jgi:CheY-like chemotaxis protein/HPt (histidine-containing phosphotransfer) domain-containing protein
VASDAPPTLPPASILLVEDGVTNRKLISLMLRRAGARVETAENGQVGLDLARQQDFDLVLMDMQMPVMDGYTATTEMRRLGITIPIIALTAHAMKGDEERCRSAGCSDYLTKPIDSDHLLSSIARVLQSPQAACPPPRSHAPSCDGRIHSTLPMDDADFREVVEEFVDHLHEKMRQMRTAVEGGDFVELAALAHWLKGAGGTAGFAALTSPAATLNRLAKDARADAIPDVLNELQGLCDRIDVPPLEFVAR